MSIAGSAFMQDAAHGALNDTYNFSIWVGV
jgi:hypothetical protein